MTYFCCCSGSRSAFNVEDRFGIAGFEFIHLMCNSERDEFGNPHFYCTVNSTVFFFFFVVCNIEMHFLVRLFETGSLSNHLFS